MAIVTPEVFADAVNAKLETSLRIARVAFDATKYVGEIKNSGSKINFPKINRIGEAVEVIKGTPLVPSEFDMSDNEATIKQIAVPVRIYDKDSIQVKGLAKENLVLQTVEEARKKIDGDLVTSMDDEAIYKSPVADGAKITSEELQLGMDLFGDNVDAASFAGIIINSKLRSSFMKMDDFVSSSKTHTENGNGVAINGVIGYYFEVPIIVCDNQTFDKTTNECKTYIVKQNALGYILQRDIAVEEAREPLLMSTAIIASAYYATKLIEAKGVVICRKTVA